MAEIPQSSFQGPLAPKYGLNDNFRNPVPGGAKIDIPKSRNYGKFIPIGAIGLALLILPLTIQQLNQQQDTRQQASEPTPTISVPVSVITPNITITPIPTSEKATNSGEITQ